MDYKIEKIANLHLGPFLKGKDKGDAKYLLASHFDEFYEPTHFDLSYVDLNRKLERELLKPNDVIMAGKGQRIFAWAYDKGMGPCIPSSIFFVLKVDSSKVIGEYLAHYLNSERVQTLLKQVGGKSTIPSIPKKEFQKLTVNIPSIAEQHKFIEMANLLKEDVSLTTDLLNKKVLLRNTILNKMIAKHINE